MIGDWEGGREYSHPAGEPDFVITREPGDLPAVAGAIADGFELLTLAPLWCFLPALWPAAHRAWVRDERVSHRLMFRSGSDGWVQIPATIADYLEAEAEHARILEQCGVRPRPPGRIWLLRMPPGRGPLDIYLSRISRAWGERGGRITADAAFAAYVAGEVGRLFEG